MNWLDITITTVFTIFMIIGLLRGLVRQVFAILAIGGGIIIATMFYDLIGSLLISYKIVINNSIANILGFVITLIISYLIIFLIGYLVLKLIGTLNLNWADRLGGGVLGGISGIVICILFVSCLTFFYGEKDAVFKNSVTTPYLKTAYALLKDSIPKDLDTEFQRARRLIQQKGIVAASKVKEVVIENSFQDKKSNTNNGVKK